MFAKSYRIRAMAESQVKLQQSSVRVLPGSLKPTVKIEPTLIKYPGTTTYSKNSQETEKFCQKILELKNLQDIGFDMEWKVSFVRNQPQPKTALVQLCYETDANQYSCLCAHVFYTGVPPSLQKILENNEIKKVGVNILNDASKFQRDFGIQINGCVELMNEARSRILDEGATIAYTGKTNMQTLVLKVLGMQIEKDDSIRKCNWEMQNLSQTQIMYAVLDAYASLLLYKKIIQCEKPKPQTTRPTNTTNGSAETQSQENIDPSSSEQNSCDQLNKNIQKGQDASDGARTFQKIDSNSVIQNPPDQNKVLKNTKQKKYEDEQKLLEDSDVNMLLNEEFAEWEKTMQNVEVVTPTKLQVYNMFMTQGKSFEEISEFKRVKLQTVEGYFCDAMQNGYQYKWSMLNITQQFSDLLMQRIKEFCPELAEVIVQVTSKIQTETGFQNNPDETKNKIINLFGELDCKNLSLFLKVQKSCGLKDLKGELDVDYSSIKFQLVHWGRILYWARYKE